MFSMVSFRNSQFQAIFIGLVIADAVSQGQMPWERSPWAISPAVGSDSSPWPGGIESDRWCHHIVNQLQSCCLETPQSFALGLPLPDGPQQSRPTGEVASLLATSPMRLLKLDHLHHRSAASPPSSLSPSDDALQMFDQSLVAALNQDAPALAALIHTMTDMAVAELSPLTQTLLQSWQQVLAAQGNFELAVGQSLYTAPPSVGLPVLTGILSAAWGGENSLPIAQRQLLETPNQSLRIWLSHRWQLTAAAHLKKLTQALWRQWSGNAVTQGVSAAMIAVQPVIA